MFWLRASRGYNVYLTFITPPKKNTFQPSKTAVNRGCHRDPDPLATAHLCRFLGLLCLWKCQVYHEKYRTPVMKHEGKTSRLSLQFLDESSLGLQWTSKFEVMSSNIFSRWQGCTIEMEPRTSYRTLEHTMFWAPSLLQKQPSPCHCRKINSKVIKCPSQNYVTTQQSEMPSFYLNNSVSPFRSIKCAASFLN